MTVEIAEVDRLDCRFVDHHWRFAEERAAEIERHWQERRRVNPALYDGSVLLACRVELITSEDGARILRMSLFKTRFSRFVAWRDFGWPDKTVSNCFSMPAVRARDGAYLLGEMAPSHSSAGQLYFPCGTPDPSDIVAHGKVDLVGNLVRELAEETGLVVAESRAAAGWTVIFDRQHIACIKRLDFDAPSQALLAKVKAFLASESAPELADALMVSTLEALSDPRLPAFMVAYLSRAFGGRMKFRSVQGRFGANDSTATLRRRPSGSASADG
ncbi:NUDIX hydrolase [Methylocystis sp. B8]|uniref:NUDIX hydrolase n=1 Tax=Methylocystis sp. B8 TaxID=544938 RepID=UPI001FED5C60|nr:NUDIX hydrolase [Methylocystis sp. B8]